eukprot:8038630-Lingulodinium_polyedra.AAC.1
MRARVNELNVCAVCIVHPHSASKVIAFAHWNETISDSELRSPSAYPAHAKTKTRCRALRSLAQKCRGADGPQANRESSWPAMQ